MIVNNVSSTNNYNTAYKGKFKLKKILKPNLLKDENNSNKVLNIDGTVIKQKIQEYAKKTSDFVVKLLDTL